MLVLLGPKSGKITGQSKAFIRFTDALKSEETLIFDRNRLVSYYFIFYVLKLCTVNASHYYLSSSRSTIGFILELPIILIAMLRNKPITCHIHGGDFGDFLIKNRLARWIYARPIIRICLIHDFFVDRIEAILRKKVFVVNNFVDYQNILVNRNKDIDLIWSSNLMVEKGILEFLKWILDNAKEDLRVVVIGNIIGTNHEIGHISALIEKCEMKLNNFVYLGAVDSEIVQDHLMRARIFVLISTYRSEAVPLALLEAMACACFVIITSFRALPNLVDPKHSIILGAKSDIFNLEPVNIIKGINEEALMTYAKSVRLRYNIKNHINQLKSIVFEYSQ